MNRHRGLAGTVLALSALLALGASPAPDPDALLREGNAAFGRGDLAEAIARYEDAWDVCNDPSLVAFNLASAKYKLALAPDGSPQALREAGQLYRCCLAPGDPRRARALYGLGNCLLLETGGRNADNLRAAVGCYEQCLKAPGGDAGLARDARYNLQKARLLLLQFQPSGDGPKDEPPTGDDPDKNPNKPDSQPTAGDKDEPGREARAGTADAAPVKPEPGQSPVRTDDTPPPGAGNLQPVPDEAEPTPLSARDAVEHLNRATRRIVEERRAHRQGRTRPPAAGVPDW